MSFTPSLHELPSRLRRAVTSPHAGGRFATLDGYRGFACLGVMLFHVVGAQGLTYGTAFNTLALNAIGNLVVTIFFLLSGFLLFRPFVYAHLRGTPAPNVVRFLRHRLLRILPAYWLVLTAMFFILPKTRLMAPNTPLDFGGYATLYTLTMNVRPGFAFYGLAVAWTLHIEICFYLALPLIAWGIRTLFSRRAVTSRQRMLANLYTVLGLIVIGIVAHIVIATKFYGALDTQDHWAINYLDWFALGMLLAIAVSWRDVGGVLPRWIEFIAKSPTACWLVGLGLYVVYMYTVQPGPAVKTSETLGQVMSRFVLAEVIILIILVPATIGKNTRDPMWRFLASPVMIYLGTVSYGLYLWHTVIRTWFLQSDWWTKANPKPSVWLSLAGVFFISLLLASVSWFALEKPLMRFKDHRFFGRRIESETIASSEASDLTRSARLDHDDGVIEPDGRLVPGDEVAMDAPTDDVDHDVAGVEVAPATELTLYLDAANEA